MSGIKLSSEQVLAYVEASLRIEGMKLPDDARGLIERMLRGEITYEEGREEILAAARARLSARNERPRQ
ncbi:hypothetical protein DX912_11410 [Lysobacter soli]|uniref:Antitoxin VbhA domain-containing protein n=1 Tax=Lysobacter soli TaxID=453783 RepID=A0A3D8VBR9_9GAMM|nr:hypothetical protein DX912_11410 [Lysobacter soli]